MGRFPHCGSLVERRMGLRAETPCCLCFLWDEFDAPIVRGTPFTIHQSLCSLRRSVDTWVSFAENILRTISFPLPSLPVSARLCPSAPVCAHREDWRVLVSEYICQWDRQSRDRRSAKTQASLSFSTLCFAAIVQFCAAYLHEVALSTAGFEKFLLPPVFEMNFY